jgi:hypothetical protein
MSGVKHPGFQFPKDDGGKYQHPWMRPLPAGRARMYDMMHRGTVFALVGISLYGFFEVARGSYHIMAANRQYAAAQVGRGGL